MSKSEITIRRAQRAKAWLKIVIDGVSGSGKTYSSLLIAKGLAPEPRVLLIDTENGSGELYSHLYDYDYIRLESPFSPAKYCAAIDAAVRNGNDIIIIDSLSHCWKYILQYKETLDAKDPRAAWGNWAKAKALFDEMKTALLQCPAHVVATLRAGSEWAESYDAKGSKKYIKIGTKPIAEPDLEYEFTLALRIERTHMAFATKDRTEQFDVAAPFTPSVNSGRKLYDWLQGCAGDLSRDWGGALRSEEAQAALAEAERLGIGLEEVPAAGSRTKPLRDLSHEERAYEARGDEVKRWVKAAGITKEQYGEIRKLIDGDPLRAIYQALNHGFKTYDQVIEHLGGGVLPIAESKAEPPAAPDDAPETDPFADPQERVL